MSGNCFNGIKIRNENDNNNKRNKENKLSTKCKFKYNQIIVRIKYNKMKNMKYQSDINLNKQK